MAVRLPGDAPILPVSLIIIGGYLSWFGVHYWRSDTHWPSQPVKDVLTGGTLTPVTHQQQQADQQGLANLVTTLTTPGPTPGVNAGTPGPPVTGNPLDPGGFAGGSGGAAIAADAQRYVGAGYVFGGNASSVGNWDCSSFTSYVLGHDMGMSLPGGRWGDPGMPPHAHGPTTGSYALFGTGINQGELAAGDLVVWSTHMGIAVSPTSVISARDPQARTGIDTIAAMTSSLRETPHFRRVV